MGVKIKLHNKTNDKYTTINGPDNQTTDIDLKLPNRNGTLAVVEDIKTVAEHINKDAISVADATALVNDAKAELKNNINATTTKLNNEAAKIVNINTQLSSFVKNNKLIQVYKTKTLTVGPDQEYEELADAFEALHYIHCTEEAYVCIASGYVQKKYLIVRNIGYRVIIKNNDQTSNGWFDIRGSSWAIDCSPRYNWEQPVMFIECLSINIENLHIEGKRPYPNGMLGYFYIPYSYTKYCCIATKGYSIVLHGCGRWQMERSRMVNIGGNVNKYENFIFAYYSKQVIFSMVEFNLNDKTGEKERTMEIVEIADSHVYFAHTWSNVPNKSRGCSEVKNGNYNALLSGWIGTIYVYAYNLVINNATSPYDGNGGSPWVLNQQHINTGCTAIIQSYGQGHARSNPDSNVARAIITLAEEINWKKNNK